MSDVKRKSKHRHSSESSADSRHIRHDRERSNDRKYHKKYRDDDIRNKRDNKGGGRSHRDTRHSRRSSSSDNTDTKHIRRVTGKGTLYMPFKRRGSSSEADDLTIEERDSRTIFVWQLAARIKPRDLEKFFSQCGKVVDVRLIMDARTGRSKGIGYVEFRKVESVTKAIKLSGERLLGVPIQVQVSQAEKNRDADGLSVVNGEAPMKLYVGSLHYNITEEMLRGIFDPFGQVTDLKLIRDSVTNHSHGYGFVHFAKAKDAKKAMEQLNGFELAGRPIKVNYVNDRMDGTVSDRSLDMEDVDRTGLNLGSTGRLALMAKLAEGTGMRLPKTAQEALSKASHSLIQTSSPHVIPTPCIQLSNMFDPRENPVYNEIADDVTEECSQYGVVLHVHVDRSPDSKGYVYMKMSTIAAAAMCVNRLNGRYFSGRVIGAEFYPVAEYNKKFPDSLPNFNTSRRS